MTEQQKKNKRRLRVTSTRQAHTWTKDDGSQGEIYEVTAVTENGQVVDPEKFPLRSFSSLQDFIDRLVEYEVREYDGGEKFGISYTLIPPKVPTQQQINALKERVLTLEEQMAAVQARVFTETPGLQQEPPPPEEPPPPPEPEPEPEGPPSIPSARDVQQPTSTVHREDDDIPF